MPPLVKAMERGLVTHIPTSTIFTFLSFGSKKITPFLTFFSYKFGQIQANGVTGILANGVFKFLIKS